MSTWCRVAAVELTPGKPTGWPCPHPGTGHRLLEEPDSCPQLSDVDRAVLTSIDENRHRARRVQLAGEFAANRLVS